MTFNFPENEGSLLAFAIAESIPDEVTKDQNFDSTKIDIRLIINNVEVDPKLWFNAVNDQLDNQVQKKALEFIENNLCELTNTLDQLRQKIDSAFKKIK